MWPFFDQRTFFKVDMCLYVDYSTVVLYCNKLCFLSRLLFYHVTLCSIVVKQEIDVYCLLLCCSAN